MVTPAQVGDPILCADCVSIGRTDVMMQFLIFDSVWMNVSVAEQDSTYRGAVSVRTQRKKVRCAIWRCPHGHRHQTVLV